MKKATIENLRQVDALAAIYTRRDQGGTVMEIAVNTRAAVGDTVEITALAAQRTIILSRIVRGLLVVHITATEWQILRGTVHVPPDVLADARECMPDAPQSSPPPARQDAGQSSRQRAQKRRALSR